ncbi:3'(2'),5'-bisphosphate nucleotidase CysQ [Thiohalophilus sp.]|uniref:3'(2'),5'-bisphosphate nucleotidase CysQ n=1 Tax=Thiohalophilus sp. TaxID=3028392 RepID=UPI002ACD3C12|nr:3'(2'),5'-bisphosphate nucleotidase CysQ [Thiohalophilus sp.]MDZ7804751.1 3'(2'),5'-bisphosphate nucleotidase CysQ [Thiohalophilus sp.]
MELAGEYWHNTRQHSATQVSCPPMSLSQQLDELIEPVKKIAYEAGRRIMVIYEQGFSVEEKHDNTPLTEADLAAHEAVEAGLQALTPRLPILSEESIPASFDERRDWQRYWLVDPLDGTREFIKRNGEFTVNIALIDNHEPVLGVVYAPVIGALYYAARGLGARKRSGLDDAHAIRVREHCPDRMVIAGSRSHQTPEFKNFIAQLDNYEIISMGSALKSCLVAEGTADLYARLGPTSEWDTAAAQCIVEEAGGCMTDTNMQPLRYNTKEELLNPHFLVFGDRSINWAEYLQ